jgi:Gnt-I system high-affinity gluconate transporter
LYGDGLVIKLQMTFLLIFAAILALVLLISWGKVNAFLAFLLVSIVTGLLLGIPWDKITAAVQKGIGDTLGSLVIVIALGAMLGKLVAESGAAQKITEVLMRAFGIKNLQWALMVTGFIVGIPLFYNVGFVLLVPIIFSIVYQTRMPAVYTGIPMLAALSVAHGFLPPHPSPSALVGQFQANMGLTLLYGIIVAIPAIILAGPIFAKTLKKIDAKPLATFQPSLMASDKLPGTFTSFMASLLPVLLLALTTLLPWMITLDGSVKKIFAFVAEPSIVMLLALFYATFSLGLGQGMSMKKVMDIYVEAVKDVSIILLIVAGAGALKEVFIQSGVSASLGALMQSWRMHPLILGWMIAALIRVAMGSATVAGLTAAGIIAPVLGSSGADPNLMVLSIGAGSLMFSHVNDSGFWMFKEYFNLSIRETIRSWSIMESIVSIAGLAGVLVLDAVL